MGNETVRSVFSIDDAAFKPICQFLDLAFAKPESSKASQFRPISRAND